MGFRMRATPVRVATAARSVERRRMPPWLSKDLPRIMRVVACLMATSGIAPLAAQQVRGRLVLASDSSAVSEALVLLLDQKRTEVARTASTP